MSENKKKQDEPVSESSMISNSQFSSITKDRINHPSRNLDARSQGFGVASGYERPFKKDEERTIEREQDLYGPIPHAGYFGAGIGLRPFKSGQAGFSIELDWYKKQYGEKTSGYDEESKKE
jgi:hypothetical protein